MFNRKKLEIMTTQKQTIQLQSVGHVPARPASEIKPGTVLMWNFGYTSTVKEIVKETAKTLVIIETSDESGKDYTRRLFKDRLVAIRPAK